ncbi:MAG: PAS domain S-box protein [Candidatus Binatia bacterium]|jgi:two-component system, NarL family, sensor histidine kinase UhpB
MITSSLPPAPSPLATILVVDDTSDSLALLAGILTRTGYQVQPVDSGELALAAVAASPPDLILLDVRMQGMDGLEVCRRLKAREETRHIPIILISAFAEPEERVEGLELGAADYIAKPFRKKELLARVKTHLSLRRAEVSLEQHAAALQQTNVKLHSEIVERQRIEAELQQSLDRAERSRRALLSTLEDQKRTEDALRQGEDRYRDLVEHSRELICTHDLEGRILSANPWASRVLGYQLDTILQMNIRDFLVPELRGEVDTYLAEIKEHGAAKGLLLVQTAAGERRIWEYDNTLRTEGVAAPIVRGTAHDITERKRAEDALRESETRFRAVFEGAGDGMFVLDLESRKFVISNAACSRMLGFTPEEFLNLGIPDLHLPEGLPFIFEEVEKFLKGEAGVRADTRFKRRDGSTFFADLNPTLITMSGRKSVLVAFRDITERKQAEDALRASAQQLRQLSARLRDTREEEQTRIAREIHDDLGQALTGLKMDLRWIEHQTEKLGAGPQMGAILDKIVTAAGLVDEIVATVQRIAAELRPGILDRLGLIATLRHEAGRFQERTGCAVRLDLPDKEPRMPPAVATAFFRICQETLTNIARHAGAGSVDIALQPEDGALLLEVRDDGKGITLRELNSRHSLGLLGMRERAAALGGEAEFRRGPERGTIISVRIPTTAAEVERA